MRDLFHLYFKPYKVARLQLNLQGLKTDISNFSKASKKRNTQVFENLDRIEELKKRLFGQLYD